MTGSFQRYLRAKKTVDDRALNAHIVAELRTELQTRAAQSDGPFRVLDIGAGIGTMIARLIEWDLFPAGQIHYRALDLEQENISALPAYLRDWAASRPISVGETGGLTLKGPDRRIDVTPTVADATKFAKDTETEYDLLVGAAVLDVIDMDVLDSWLGTLASSGVYYFPITFDGGTRFRPAHPADRDIERCYHDHMDAKPGGSSRAGGDALHRLQRMPGVSVEAGGSDWIVTPTDGAYPADEASFLRYILDTIDTAVREQSAGEFTQLDEWLSHRRAQVAAGELLYLTHQLDLLGTVADPPTSTAEQI